MSEYYGVRRSGSDSEAYIAHAFGLSGVQKAGHKYLARIARAGGKGWRYIYTQAELAAAKAGNATRGAVSSVKRSASKAAKGVDRIVGVSQQKKFNEVRRKYEDAAGRAAQDPNSNHSAALKAGREYRNQIKEYDKTLLGKASKLGVKIRKNKAESTLSEIRSKNKPSTNTGLKGEKIRKKKDLQNKRVESVTGTERSSIIPKTKRMNDILNERIKTKQRLGILPSPSIRTRYGSDSRMHAYSNNKKLIASYWQTPVGKMIKKKNYANFRRSEARDAMENKAKRYLARRKTKKSLSQTLAGAR